VNEATTIRVSKKRVKKQRRAVLEKAFGIDRGKIKPFSEKDRED
jgi:hypothetical protein